MVFLKDKTIKFRLKDLEAKPDFSIWKAWDKKGEDYKDSAGNAMKFPIRDGMLTNEKGDVKEVADLKFMTNKDFKEQYPKYQRKFSSLRQVYVDSVEYTYRFTSASNTKLVQKINDLKLMGKDPLTAEFHQVFDNAKAPVDKYSINLLAVDLPKVEAKQPADVPNYNPKISKEQEIMEAMKNSGQAIDEARFIDIMKKNGIDETKSKELYKEYSK